MRNFDDFMNQLDMAILDNNIDDTFNKYIRIFKKNNLENEMDLDYRNKLFTYAAVLNFLEAYHDWLSED